MIRSKSKTSSYTQYFWVKPWKKIGGMMTAWPYLCMKCGKMGIYLEPRDLETIKEEYEKVRY